jgi:hypothetical protein
VAHQAEVVECLGNLAMAGGSPLTTQHQGLFQWGHGLVGPSRVPAHVAEGVEAVGEHERVAGSTQCHRLHVQPLGEVIAAALLVDVSERLQQLAADLRLTEQVRLQAGGGAFEHLLGGERLAEGLARIGVAEHVDQEAIDGAGAGQRLLGAVALA